MRHILSTLVLGIFFAAGCHTHPLTDYRPLDQAGMSSSSVEQLKALNTSDTEVLQLVKLKQSGVSDETCLELLAAAHAHSHPFYSADSAANLSRAGFTGRQIIEIAKVDQLDSLSGDAVMLRLVGLSDSTVETLMQRRMHGKPTLSSAQIGRLKNTGLSERQIMERVDRGMTDEQANREAATREAVRNHSHTDFVRMHGRRNY